MLLDLAQTIEYLQSFEPPYIHHDIKSSNVLLLNPFNKNGPNEIRLCDFGLMEHEVVIVSGFTPTNAAPEIIMGDLNYNKKSSEIYSFAVFCWELFANQIVYEGMGPDEVQDKVKQGMRPIVDDMEQNTPIELKILIQKCFDNDKDNRPSINEFKLAIIKAIRNKI